MKYPFISLFVYVGLTKNHLGEKRIPIRPSLTLSQHNIIQKSLVRHDPKFALYINNIKGP